ncbi:hypothetical protein J31TS3_48750 [Paenibacillus lactis]|nr:hypothetical protein J31TS3_48750 [Paenibacillus lactis]
MTQVTEAAAAAMHPAAADLPAAAAPLAAAAVEAAAAANNASVNRKDAPLWGLRGLIGNTCLFTKHVKKIYGNGDCSIF